MGCCLKNSIKKMKKFAQGHVVPFTKGVMMFLTLFFSETKK
jgi:hypothetical protein